MKRMWIAVVARVQLAGAAWFASYPAIACRAFVAAVIASRNTVESSQTER
jgi:hypothetical protein